MLYDNRVGFYFFQMFSQNIEISRIMAHNKMAIKLQICAEFLNYGYI